MTWPICGSQVNVPDPAAGEDDEAADDEDDELAGTATDQVPASPSVPSSSVWLVSDCRVTVAVPVWYPLLAPAAGLLDPRNAPLASAVPTAGRGDYDHHPGHYPAPPAVPVPAGPPARGRSTHGWAAGLARWPAVGFRLAAGPAGRAAVGFRWAVGCLRGHCCCARLGLRRPTGIGVLVHFLVLPDRAHVIG